MGLVNTLFINTSTPSVYFCLSSKRPGQIAGTKKPALGGLLGRSVLLPEDRRPEDFPLDMDVLVDHLLRGVLLVRVLLPIEAAHANSAAGKAV